MEKKISIALATYNGAVYLEPLLESLLLQTYQPYELVVSDDNSTDETLEIMEAFAAKASFPVQIIANNSQLGIIDNFAKAFTHCNGDLIAYCDQDDVWAKEKLAECVKCFSDPDVKLALHRSEVVDGELNPLGYRIPGDGIQEYGTVHFPSTADMTYGLGHQFLFDREVYDDYAWIFSQGHSPLQSIAGNYDTLFRFLAGMNGSIVSLDTCLVKFRRHDNATSDAGLVDNKIATKSGFLDKTAWFYTDEADALNTLAACFEKHIIHKMPNYSSRLRQYVEFVRARATLYDLRGKLYSKCGLFKRIRTYLNLVTSSAYRRKGNGGFGNKALLVDAFVTVFGLSVAKKIIALKG